MKVEEIIDSIYEFVGDKDDWIEFEKKIENEISELNENETEELIQSEAMEHLLMVCDGIRYSKKNKI